MKGRWMMEGFPLFSTSLILTVVTIAVVTAGILYISSRAKK
ncbi:hypothetical protein JMA_31550 [Jeotgalibacillus malaysiensis]|uniref:Uncharacterized protein n=1 Tax=Jeotgalibacillus malaysiensis TaxID=1508404 RepID=A0A0B5AUR3_9BACL|nr:hypothetical protein JMA_31550 [Jeotgalibacillus malaysiensis]